MRSLKLSIDNHERRCVLNEQSIKQLALKGGNLVSKLYTRQHHAPALLASACEAQLDDDFLQIFRMNISREMIWERSLIWRRSQKQTLYLSLVRKAKMEIF